MLDQLNFLSHNRVVPIAASAQLIREGIGKLYDRTEDMAIAYTLGLDPNAGAAETSEREAERMAREQPVVTLVADLISSAVHRRASDIHLRPGEHGADILFRIDDEMVPVRRLIHALQPAVVSRIKVLANMNLAEHRKAQDGRTTFVLEDGRKVDLRISVLPAVFGESVVVRLLDSAEGLVEPRATGPDSGRPAAPGRRDVAQPRHVPDHRSDRLRQVHHPVRDAARTAQGTDQHPHHRGSGRVLHRRHPADAGQPRRQLRLSPARCAISCATTPM